MIEGALRRVFSVSEPALGALVAIATRRSFPRGSWLLRAGERATSAFLVTRGLVRELYVDDAGAEHTRVFVAEGHLTGSLLDLLSGAPSITWIQALEDVEAVALAWSGFEAACERHPELHVVARRNAEALCVRKIRREHELLTLPAAARLARFRAEFPAIDERVSRRHLASYLGVTPETLSRLRAARTRRPSGRDQPKSR